MPDDLSIDFLYVDLSECERCLSSDETLDRALRELRDQIHQNNIDSITVNKRKIRSDEQAKKHGLIRSPTLRINGTDIEGIVNEDYEVKDSYCPSCEDVTGPECYEITGGGNDCRVFEYEGETYETIPKEMIKEAVRKEVGMEKETKETCCEEEEQTSSCCGPTTSCC
ncbi:MAG: DUF2703 domain-containing protein [Candidatus Thermoplasmatota archaeon]|nr:DUF2703 domain-containing protein [Candidatus Thermoplasmatota archaeon]